MTQKADTETLNEILDQFTPDHHLLIEVGQRIGAENLQVMLDLLGGGKVYIPTAEWFWGELQRAVRDEQIRRSHRGDVRETAARFSLGPRQTRRILAEKPHVNFGHGRPAMSAQNSDNQSND